jgi:hypothetical protein
MLKRIYNYPWSGKLGVCTSCCIICGDGGMSFQLSSSGYSCTQCRPGAEPQPHLLQAMLEEESRRIDDYCKKHDIDREAIVKVLEEFYGGPQDQEV